MDCEKRMVVKKQLINSKQFLITGFEKLMYDFERISLCGTAVKKITNLIGYVTQRKYLMFIQSTIKTVFAGAGEE